MARPLFLSTFALLALACSSNASTSGGTGQPGTGDPNAPGGSSSTPTTHPNEELVTLTMGPFTVPPNGEVYKCQNFANPFGDVDQDVKEYEVHMTSGSHHMFLFFDKSNKDAPVEDCPQGGLEFHPYPFGAQSADASMRYPDDVGSLVPRGTGFRVSVHYLNPGDKPLEATVKAVMHKAAPGTVNQHAGVIFMNDVGINVPPGKSTTNASCTLASDVMIMTATSHMHQRATAFSAKTKDGVALYETDQWADPKTKTFAPALALAKGTEIEWGCGYNNETGKALRFGESAEDNVMCIFSATYYPVKDPKDPTIECQSF